MSNKIAPLYKSLLKHKDRITISNRVYDALELLLSDDKECMTLLSVVKEQNSALKYALSQVKRESLFTSQLRNVVSERAAVILYIKNVMKAQSLCSFDNALQKAARMLNFELNHAIHANKIRNYAGGSIAAEEIIKACAKKKNSERVKLLGLEAALIKLAEIQAAFIEIYTTKVTTEHGKKDINISKASGQLLDKIESLFDYISIQAILKKGIYIKATKSINEIIEDVITVARARKTRHTNHDEGKIVKNMQNADVVELAA